MRILTAAARHLPKNPMAKASLITLPPPGPAWFGAVMGTGILANLLQLNAPFLPFGHSASLVLLLIGWLIFVLLLGLFVLRSCKDYQSLVQSITDTRQTPLWGMVSMGFLALGAATATVLPAHYVSLTLWAWRVDGVLWCTGTVIGIVSAMGFACLLMSTDCGDPTPVWGLPIVPPMVSATTGAALIPHISTLAGRFWLDVVCAGCFFSALALGVAVFITAYHHAWRCKPLPLAASAASWIPLGIVGQSTAAAQAMTIQTLPLLQKELADSIHQMANVYGYIMLSIGVPLFAWAFVVTLKGFLQRMPFTPGWWAMTFPVGTCCLGTYFLGINAHPFFALISVVLCLFLCLTWSIAFIGSAWHIARHCLLPKNALSEEMMPAEIS